MLQFGDPTSSLQLLSDPAHSAPAAAAFTQMRFSEISNLIYTTLQQLVMWQL